MTCDILWKKRFQLQKYKLRILGAKIDAGNTFFDWVLIVGDYKNLKIGKCNIFNQSIILNLSSELTIGDNNHFSAGVKVMTTRLDLNLISHTSFPVTIGNNNWFATDSLVAVGKNEINIGNGNILGAKSFLNKSIQTPGMYMGVPATLRNNSLFPN